MTRKQENLTFGAIFLCAAAVYYFLAERLPDRNLPNTLGIDTMPKVFAVFLAFLSMLLVANALRGGKRKPASRRDELSRGRIQGVAIVFGMMTAYIILIDIAGFVVVTPFFMFGLMYIEGVRRYGAMAAVSLISTGAVYTLFRYVFKVRITGFPF